MVVLTARDEKRGFQALDKLKESGLSHNLVFHQLDVANPISVASLAIFLNTQFGKLDILPLGEEVWNEIITSETYDMVQDCLKTNYYGMKAMVEALLPLLNLSDSARIVNVSSNLGVLELMTCKWAKEGLSDVEKLSEERVELVLNKYLEDFRDGALKTNGWPTYIGPSTYIVSKAAMNAYTRILAKNYPRFCINCVHPGFVKTDITGNTGFSTPAQGAENVVRVALLPIGASSGFFYNCQQVSSF
ncbi:hypothetical protein V6Z12_A07G165200 [Gossypium hirsutum]